MDKEVSCTQKSTYARSNSNELASSKRMWRRLLDILRALIILIRLDMAEVGRSNRPEPIVFHAFFNELSSLSVPSMSEKKLSTLQGKLSTRSKVNRLTPTQEIAVAISGQASSPPLKQSSPTASIEADKHTLDNLMLSFTLEELSYYVKRRNFGLADKSQDWIIRAARDFWCSTQGIIPKRH